MNKEQKKQVSDALLSYADRFDTPELAADSLKDIIASTIMRIRNNEWESVSERLWHSIARQLGFNSGEWQPADTSAYLLLRIILNDAQHYAMTYGVAMGEGFGKTFTANQYALENSNVFYIACTPEHTPKSFLTALMNVVGIESKGTMPHTIQRFAEHVNGIENSLVIIDGMDKLKLSAFQLAVKIAGSIAGRAGLVVMGRDKLRSYITKGVRHKIAGCDELYKMMRRKLITLACPGPKDVELVCRANGVCNDVIIDQIKGESATNLHVTKEMIQLYRELIKAA